MIYEYNHEMNQIMLEQSKTIQELKEIIEQAKEALMFYAFGDWNGPFIDEKTPNFLESGVFQDRGQRAFEVFRTIQGLDKKPEIKDPFR